VRVMQNNIFLDTFQTLGTNATPMAFGEVFTALETRAIDAQENPYVTIDTSKFYEVQGYVSATQHAYTPFMVLFSGPIWGTLSAEEQQILRDCAAIGRDEQRSVSRALSGESLANVQANGMQFNEIDPAEMVRIREAVAGVYERSAATIGQDVIDQMMAELEAIRGQ
jgi:TRAP-type C4-dicarboxylate transport system substrate-binding protein